MRASAHFKRSSFRLRQCLVAKHLLSNLTTPRTFIRSGAMPPRHKKRSRFDHSICTTAGSLRQSVANDLAIMDENATFRFMDLHTELRLLIYAELLHNDGCDESKKLYPQILATCKAVYNEAYPDFEKNSHLNVTNEGGIEKRKGIKEFKDGRVSENLPYFACVTAYSMMGNQPTRKSLSPYVKLASFRAKMAEQFKSVQRAHLKLSLGHIDAGLYEGVVTQPERRRLQLDVACGVGKLVMAICSALRHHNVKIIHLELGNDIATGHTSWFSPKFVFDLMMWPVCICLETTSQGSYTTKGIPPELKTLLLENKNPYNTVPDVLGDCEKRMLLLSNLVGLLTRTGVMRRGALNQLAREGGFVQGTLGTRLIPPPHFSNDASEEFDRILRSEEVQEMRALALSRLEPKEAAMWAKVT